MNKLFSSVVVSATAAILLISTPAQTPVPTHSPTHRAVEPDDINYRLYTNFLSAFRKGDEPAALEAARTYLQHFPSDNRQGQYLREWIADYEIKLFDNFIEAQRNLDNPAALQAAQAYLERYPEEPLRGGYLRKWIANYEEAQRKLKRGVRKLIEAQKFKEGFELGKEILASEPEDIDTIRVLAGGGVLALTYGDNAFVKDANNYAKKALKLIEPGRVSANGGILSELYFDLGIFSMVSAPEESAAYMSKAMQFETFKNDPWTYSLLAYAITEGQYRPAYLEYESRFPTPEHKDSTEGRISRAKLDLLADQIVDALARAVKLADSEPRHAENTIIWRKALTSFYRSRNSNYETGLAEYIEGVLATPFPFQLLYPIPQLERRKGAAP